MRARLAFGFIACISLVSWTHPEYGIELESKLRGVYLIAGLEVYQGICRGWLNSRTAPENIQNYSSVGSLREQRGFVNDTANYRWISDRLSNALQITSRFARYHNVIPGEESNLRQPRRRFVSVWCGFDRLITERALFNDQVGFGCTRGGARNEPQRDPDPERRRATAISYSHSNPEARTREQRVDESRGRFGLKDGIFFGDGNPWSPIYSHLHQLTLENPSRPASESRSYDANGDYQHFTKCALTFMSMLLITIGLQCISKGVDAGYKSHIRAFVYIAIAVPCIWGALAIFIFKVLRIPFL